MSVAVNRTHASEAGLAFETASVAAVRRYMSDVFRSHALVAPVTMTAPEMDGFYLFQFILSERDNAELAQLREQARAPITQRRAAILASRD